MSGIAAHHFVIMHLLRPILLCTLIIYCVIEVQSQIKDAVPIDDVISVKSANSVKDEKSSGKPRKDLFENEKTTNKSGQRIVGGVDDERMDIRGFCPIKVDPTPDLPTLSSPLECARTCNDHERPRICYYRFVVEYYSVLSKACQFCKSNATNAFCNNCQCASVDGVERPIMTVNRMIPGPSIDVCEGDRIVVDVVNNMDGNELTIHWHGLFQRGSQYYDGAALVTQCPISAQTTFRYQFNADNAGTHFWHAHTGLQKLDGISGQLIIRQPEKRDVNNYLYDFDLSRHGIIINDWMHELSTSRLPGRLLVSKFQDPDSILINGKGQYQDLGSGVVTSTDRQIFHVTQNYRYRFRFVNAFCTVCSAILTIQNHNLTIIATDGISVKPRVVNSIISVSGERYDFVINTGNPIGSYWIQLRAMAPCGDRNIQQLAILQYKGASGIPQTPVPTFIMPLPEGIILNPLDGQCHLQRNDSICVSNLDSAVPIDGDIFTKTPDAKIYLPFTFSEYDLQELFTPNTFKKFIVTVGFRHLIASVNNITLAFPPSPPLTQLKDIPSDMICDSMCQSKNSEKICSCTNIMELPYRGMIELIIVDETKVPGLYHPFHLHGYAFNIMSTGIPNNGTGITVEEIKSLDRQGLLPRRTTSPPFKDTIAVPNNGYAIIRFRADNPGYWLFHCHFIYHLALGMGAIFHVGEQSDLPRIPQDFPQCGNYLPSISQY